MALAPILRAGIAMTDALLSLHPDATVFHLGLFREKVTLQPVRCVESVFLRHRGDC